MTTDLFLLIFTLVLALCLIATFEHAGRLRRRLDRLERRLARDEVALWKLYRYGHGHEHHHHQSINPPTQPEDPADWWKHQP